MDARKTVIITGSSRGIGKALAKEFSKNNYNVVINALKSKDKLEELEIEIKKYNQNVLSVMADVSMYEDAKKMYDKTIDKFGSVDILINNAGVCHYDLFTDTSPEDWQKVISVNLFSVMNMCHLVIKGMVSKKAGSIINISSVWGVVGASCESVYAASKGSVNLFTKSLAKELALSNINVNAIAAGVIDTDMNNNLSEYEKCELMKEISQKRFGTPEEVAKLGLFLASEKAKYITGQIISVDGGLT